MGMVVRCVLTLSSKEERPGFIKRGKAENKVNEILVTSPPPDY